MTKLNNVLYKVRSTITDIPRNLIAREYPTIQNMVNDVCWYGNNKSPAFISIKTTIRTEFYEISIYEKS